MVDDGSTTLRRQGDPAAPAQVTPATVRPASLAEAAEVLRTAAEAEEALLFAGARSALSWGGRPARTGLVVETTGLDRPISHAAEDWTVSVQAGMSLNRLQELLAPAGQWLPYDPPAAAEGATLGGLLATADAGPRRQAYGALGDLVIGATLVLPDGSVVRSGGAVIKNVAGYDLAKLLSGSLGAFGLAAELTLRVHPRPESTATVAVAVEDAGQALAAARAVLRSPLEPVATEWDGEQLLVRFHGTADATATRLRLAAAIPELAGATPLDEDAADAAWERIDGLIRGGDGDTVLRAGARPAHLPALVRSLREVTGGTGVEAAICSSAAIGVHTVRLRGGDARAHADCLTAWREAVHAHGGTVTLRRRRDGVDDTAEPWGPEPGTAPLLRALKRRFDPDGRCAPGRFAPWF